MQAMLRVIWSVCMVLLFGGGLVLIILWLLRAYHIPLLVHTLPDDAFEPWVTLLLYITGFSGVGSLVAWLTQRASGPEAAGSTQRVRAGCFSRISNVRQRGAANRQNDVTAYGGSEVEDVTQD